MLAAVASAQGESWFGVYLGPRKIGFVRERQTRIRQGGRWLQRIDTRMEMELRLTTRSARIVSQSVTVRDPTARRTLSTWKREEAAGKVERLAVTFAPRRVRWTRLLDGVRSEGTVSIPPGATLLDLPGDGGAFVPRIGWTRRGPAFSLNSLKLVDTTVTVEGKDVIPVAGVPTPAYRLRVNDTDEAFTFVDARGTLLRTDLALGISLRRESGAVARRRDAGALDQVSLARLVAVVPTGVSLQGPGCARSAAYRLRGIVGPLPEAEGIQTVRAVGERVLEVTVAGGPLPERAGIERYARALDAPEALRSFLMPTATLQSGDPALAATARRAVGDEMDLARAAAKLSEFVHRALRYDLDSVEVHDALQVHRRGRGVCRDFATYYTALARAAGIPARECLGLVFVDGAFYYHAWPQVWTGKWVALEPTWGAPFADGTHILLAYGDARSDAWKKSLGRFKIEVLRAQRDSEERQ